MVEKNSEINIIRVKIINSRAWYKHCLHMIFNVVESKNSAGLYKVSTDYDKENDNDAQLSQKFIFKSDCKIISNKPYTIEVNHNYLDKIFEDLTELFLLKEYYKNTNPLLINARAKAIDMYKSDIIFHNKIKNNVSLIMKIITKYI